MTDQPGAYLDASALVKLVRDEPESSALESSLADWPHRMSSELAFAEVTRAARRESPGAAATATLVLSAINLYAVDREILRRAGELEPASLRTLDAIHVATALVLGPLIGTIYAYDRRLTDAARAAGLNVEAPA